MIFIIKNEYTTISLVVKLVSILIFSVFVLMLVLANY